MTTKTQASSFVRNFAERANLSIREAHRIKQAFTHALQQEVLTNGKAVIIQDLGTFYKRHRIAKAGESPSGKSFVSKAHDYLAFRAASCNRKYGHPVTSQDGCPVGDSNGTFEPVARLNTNGSVDVIEGQNPDGSWKMLER